MTNSSRRGPGIAFESIRSVGDVETLRTDIAGFAGGTHRGPVGQLVRVNNWREYLAIYGPESALYDLPLAVKAYFENGGEYAYILRLLPALSTSSNQTWLVGDVDPIAHEWGVNAPGQSGFSAYQYNISAKNPGDWSNNCRVAIRYLYSGKNGLPEVKLHIVTSRGEEERLEHIRPQTLEDDINNQSQLITVKAVAGTEAVDAAHIGPMRIDWPILNLSGANELETLKLDYLNALNQMIEEPEIALMAFPDLYRLPTPDSNEVFAKIAAYCDQTMDRQFIAAPPKQLWNESIAQEWVQARRAESAGITTRSVSVYYPWVNVEDPTGGITNPLRTIAPVGHVAGVISRLDRERGAHHTPANAEMYSALDLADTLDEELQSSFFESGINLLRCASGRGLQVWGGRTLIDKALYPEYLYLAHRRLLHRLVRAVRRVSAPLVFGVNNSQLWLTLVRAITSVLLEAYRAGALQGDRAEQAFRVTCDETNNPPHLQDEGQVNCTISVAPAVPLEFITLRIRFGREGRLEVIDA